MLNSHSSNDTTSTTLILTKLQVTDSLYVPTVGHAAPSMPALARTHTHARARTHARTHAQKALPREMRMFVEVFDIIDANGDGVCCHRTALHCDVLCCAALLHCTALGCVHCILLHTQACR